MLFFNIVVERFSVKLCTCSCICSVCTVYDSPNSKQQISRAEDCEQFCYRDGDHFHGFSRVLSLTKLFITQVHLSNEEFE